MICDGPATTADVLVTAADSLVGVAPGVVGAPLQLLMAGGRGESGAKFMIQAGLCTRRRRPGALADAHKAAVSLRRSGTFQ